MYDDDYDGDWTSGFRSRRIWVRGFFMLVFLFILWLARLLLIVLAVFQFGALLIARRPVGRLLPFGRSLAFYLQEIGLYLTCNSEDKPFPFAPWPEPGPGLEEDGEEGEPWEEYEPYPAADAAYAPEPEGSEAVEPEEEPEPEPETEPEPKEKPKTSRKKKGGSKKASDGGAPEDTEDAGNPGDSDGNAEDVEDDDDPGGRPPPRPDA